MTITLTDNAVQHVEKMLQQQPAIGLRFRAKKSGCTGFSYVVDYADKTHDDDQVYESHGIKILIDNASLPMLEGMTVDYVKQNLLNEGFEFINPNIKEMCGCGESFSV